MKDLTRLKRYVVMEAYATRDGGRKHKLDVLFKTYNQFYNFMFKNYNHYFFEKIELVKTSYDIHTNLILEINRNKYNILPNHSPAFLVQNAADTTMISNSPMELQAEINETSALEIKYFSKFGLTNDCNAAGTAYTNSIIVLKSFIVNMKTPPLTTNS